MEQMSTPTPNDLLRTLPAVQILLDDAAIKSLETQFGREAVLAAARETLADLRAEILGGRYSGGDLRAEAIARVLARIEKKCSGGVRRVINGPGVILRTGLGRAVLPPAAIQEIVRELSGYAAVEVDVESGKRGHRDDTTRELVTTLLGCEHATVVNNNAAATMLALAAIARVFDLTQPGYILDDAGHAQRAP